MIVGLSSSTGSCCSYFAVVVVKLCSALFYSTTLSTSYVLCKKPLVFPTIEICSSLIDRTLLSVWFSFSVFHYSQSDPRSGPHELRSPQRCALHDADQISHIHQHKSWTEIQHQYNITTWNQVTLSPPTQSKRSETLDLTVLKNNKIHLPFFLKIGHLPLPSCVFCIFPLSDSSV